ncbi:MAG: CAP domain-containing protein, partial [Acidobacteria bacterium]|nr:CAP domain-containing protein [Acidobacteriota bacterium]
MSRILVFLGSLLLCLALSGQEVEDYGLSPEQLEDKLLVLVNRERGSQGLPELRFDPLLREMARAHSKKMIGENRLGHDFPGYEKLDERAARAGVYFSKVGENVAKSETFVIRFFHEALLASPEHRENILDGEFTHLGVGIEKSGATYFVTQEFGRL